MDWSPPAGEKVYGTLQKDTGYRKIYVCGKNMYLHRIIYQLISGDIPNHIDHISGDRSDNRIENLRNVDQCENMLNLTVKQPSFTGFYGVYKTKQDGVFRVFFKKRKETITVGRFRCVKSAVLAYNERLIEVLGEFSRSKVDFNIRELKRRGLI